MGGDSLDGSCAACELNPRAASPFPACKDDLDCVRFGASSSTKQFCATKCFSGYCGPDAKAAKDAPGKFCQPCMTCQNPKQQRHPRARSRTHSRLPAKLPKQTQPPCAPWSDTSPHRPWQAGYFCCENKKYPSLATAFSLLAR